jgi:hypothetical protein
MPPDVTNSPLIVWVAIGTGILVIIATAVPKILVPLSDSWLKLIEQRQRVQSERDDADLAERDRQIRYLREELAKRDAYLNDLDAWVWKTYAAMRQAGINTSPPPARFRPTPMEDY